MITFHSSIHRIAKFLRILKKFQTNLVLTEKVLTICRHHATYSKTHIPTNGPWNVLFFGTDAFSMESLKSLYNKYRARTLNRLEIVTVNKYKDNDVTKYAKKHNIIIHPWPVKTDISDFHIGIVVSFGHLIPSHIIHAFPLGMLNVHASVLPRWRGASPIVHALINGDSQTGVTIMTIMPKKFDIGEIVLKKSVDIGPDETFPELHAKLSTLGADLLTETIENLPDILESAVPQNETNATYAPKITSKISTVVWNEMSAKNIYNLYRGLFGIYPLTAKFNDIKIKLLEIEEVQEESIPKELQSELPGAAIYDKINNTLLVKCKEQSLIGIKKLLLSGRSPITARDFHNGFLSGRKQKKVFFQ